MKTIVINGKKYHLIPVGDKQKPQKRAKRVVEAKKEGILSDYSLKKPEEVKKAVGKLSDYRERFKKRQISPLELIAKPKLRQKLTQTDRDLDRFNYKGESLFFGPGIEEEY